MKTVLQLQPQDVRHRGPAANYVPQCDPKLRPKKEDNIVPKIHLSFIPPSLRRPSPWGAFLSDWLASCEEKRNSESSSSASSSSPDGSQPDDGSPPPRYPEDEAGSTSGRSTGSSGACSGDTVTTDFSSVSSPRNVVEYRTAHPVIRQSQPACGGGRYPFRGVPRAASTGANLSPAQWAELAALQQTAAVHQRQQQHGPPKLMNIHTAYFPDLDAAVLQMMQQRKPAPPSRPSSPNGQPWLPHSHYYPTDQRTSIRGASSTSSDSAHYSDCRDRTQPTCDFCYQFAVHEAVGKAAHLPRLTDRGPWRGHPTKQGEMIVCPRLLRRVCSMCGATGQAAHLTNLCPVTNRKTSRY